jgi:hypothetical protein
VSRLQLILGLELALAWLAISLSALPWPFKILIGLVLLRFARIPRKVNPSSKTVMSSWGIFHEGIAYFPHQFSSRAQYHELLLRLKLGL